MQAGVQRQSAPATLDVLTTTQATGTASSNGVTPESAELATGQADVHDLHAEMTAGVIDTAPVVDAVAPDTGEVDGAPAVETEVASDIEPEETSTIDTQPAERLEPERVRITKEELFSPEPDLDLDRADFSPRVPPLSLIHI